MTAELNKPIRPVAPVRPGIAGALISIEPETGDVVAMVGGYSFQESQFNRATQAFRQPARMLAVLVGAALLTMLLEAPRICTRPNPFSRYSGL